MVGRELKCVFRTGSFLFRTLALNKRITEIRIQVLISTLAFLPNIKFSPRLVCSVMFSYTFSYRHNKIGKFTFHTPVINSIFFRILFHALLFVIISHQHLCLFVANLTFMRGERTTHAISKAKIFSY